MNNFIKKTYSQIRRNLKIFHIKSMWLCGRLCIWILQKVMFKLGDKNFIPTSDERISYLQNYKYELCSLALSSVVKDRKLPGLLNPVKFLNYRIEKFITRTKDEARYFYCNIIL